MQTVRHWLVYIVGRLLPAAVAFGSVALYTRLLDPASFGTYALLLSTSFTIGLIGFSWLRVTSLRMVASAGVEETPNLLATIALSFLAVAVPVCGIIVLVVRFYEPALGWTPALLAAACALASAWFELNVAIVQARLQSVAYGLLQMGRVLCTLGASVALIFAGYKATALLGGFVIGNLIGFAAIGQWKDAFRGRFELPLVRKIFMFGWPSSAGSIGYFSNTFQRYALQIMGGSALVGVFAAATDFSQQTIGLLMGTATLAGQPLAFRARDLGARDQLSEQLRMNARVLFAIGLPATAGLIALAGPISHIYLGPRFHLNAGPVMAIAAGTMFLSGLRGGYFEQAFEIAFQTRAVAINSIARVALTILLSMWLIPAYGVIGAALALLGAEVVGLVLSVLWARRIMHVPIPSLSWLKIAAATAAMLGAVALTPWHSTILGLAAAMAVGAVVYAAAIAAMHVRGVRAFVASFVPPAQQRTPL